MLRRRKPDDGPAEFFAGKADGGKNSIGLVFGETELGVREIPRGGEAAIFDVECEGNRP